jgi:hypothetical protein
MISEVVAFLRATRLMSGSGFDMMAAASTAGHERAGTWTPCGGWTSSRRLPPGGPGERRHGRHRLRLDGDDAVASSSGSGWAGGLREHRFLISGGRDDAILVFWCYYVPAVDPARRWCCVRPGGRRGTGGLIPETTGSCCGRGALARNWRTRMPVITGSLRLESFAVEERADDPVYALGATSACPRCLAASCADISWPGKDTVAARRFRRDDPQTNTASSNQGPGAAG